MPERTPLVAANWKMHKTTAETADFLERFTGRARRARRGGRRRLPAVHLAAGRRRLAAGARRSRIAAQNVHDERPGRSRARSRSRCSPTSASPGRSSATPSGASCSARPTRRWRARCRRCSTPRCCRSSASARPSPSATAGETEAVLRRQLEADLADVDDAALARAGRRLRADLGDRHGAHRDARAGRGGDRVHPRADRRPRRRRRERGPDPLRRLGEARQRRGALRAARRSTAAWSAAPRSTRAISPRSARPRARDRSRGPASVAGARRSAW